MAERIQQIGELWNGEAAPAEQVENAPEQLAELERQLAELDADPEGEES